MFFDSEYCLSCGSRLGFNPITMVMLALHEAGDWWLDPNGNAYHLCNNGVEHQVCNWIVPENDPHPLCQGCRFNRTVPNQALPGNQQRWLRLEEGKKRLLYTLMQLGLPLENGWESPDTGLLLDFIEDERSQVAYAETFVHTGYLGGVITINTLPRAPGAVVVAPGAVRRHVPRRGPWQAPPASGARQNALSGHQSTGQNSPDSRHLSHTCLTACPVR